MGRKGIAGLTLARRMGGKGAGALGLLLALVFVAGAFTAPAFAWPQMPHQFYGNVTSGGNSVGAGVVVSAKIGGVEYASTTTDSQGRYGYGPFFYVPADDPDTASVKEGGVKGDTVEFYVGGLLGGSFTFDNGLITNLNLAVTPGATATATATPVTTPTAGIPTATPTATPTPTDTPAPTATAPSAPPPGALPPAATPTRTPTPTPSPEPTLTETPTVVAIPTPTPAPMVSISLAQGWNLVSVPRQLVDSSVGAVFTGIANKVYYLNASGGWDYAMGGGGAWAGNLTNIEEGKGYWINAISEGSVALNLAPRDPAAPAPSYALHSGWNMIGYTSRDLAPSASVAAYLAALSDKWTTLFRYDPLAGFEIAKPGYGFSTVDLGRGYLVDLRSAGTLAPLTHGGLEPDGGFALLERFVREIWERVVRALPFIFSSAA